jgi:ferritin-like metal-binding protein YciE
MKTQLNQTKSPKSEVATGLYQLFEDSLKDIYYAEKALVKALPKMAKEANSGVLEDAINEHLSVTEGHVERLEKVFASIGIEPQSEKCEAIVVRDAGIIAAGQKVEHYEIATYGTLVAFAKTLGESEAAHLLAETLEEEKVADTKLSAIAESSINVEAV